MILFRSIAINNKFSSYKAFMFMNFKYSFSSSQIITPINPPQIQQSNNNMIWLSKYISNSSVCSRKQAQKIIQLGLIRIDGKRVFHNIMIPQNAEIKSMTPLGVTKSQPVIKLWMINKPRGYICTHNDPERRPTVYSLLPQALQQYGKIHSIGRLDFNSQGLLLLTNNVPLKNILQSPQTKLFRYYRVKVHGRIDEKKLQKMQTLTVINGKQYGPLKVTVDRVLTTNSWLKISMLTGKNRQIRKIMQKCDLQVNKLVRQQYGPYKLGKLLHGQFKQLEVTPNLLRKINKKTAQNLIQKKNKNSITTLVQIDIRDQAIKYAKQQLQFKRRKQLRQKQLEQKQTQFLQENLSEKQQEIQKNLKK